MIDFGKLLKEVEELPTVEAGLNRVLTEIEGDINAIAPMIGSVGALASALVKNTEAQVKETDAKS